MQSEVHRLAVPQTAHDLDMAFEEVVSRLELFGISRDKVDMDERGHVALSTEDMMRVLELEANTGFRSPFALGRALDTRREYRHMGILAIKLDLTGQCDVTQPDEVDAILRHLATNVRELDACYRCVDTTLVMLLPETGTRGEVMGAARRIQTALAALGIESDIGASATRFRTGALGHEYMGSALVALSDAVMSPDRIAFAEV